MVMPIPREGTLKPLLILTEFLHLLENLLVEDDSQIQVAVRWFVSDKDGVGFQNPHRIIEVSASDLVRLRIGQRFSDVEQLRVAQPLNEPLLGHVEDVVLEARDSCTMQLHEIEAKFKIQYLELTNNRNACQPVAENLWMEVIRATDGDGRPVVLILPHVIIVQAFFLGSSVAVRSLFRGELVENFADHCEIIEAENGERIAHVDRQTGWKDPELCLAAQLKADPEMRRAARSVFAYALKAKDAIRQSGEENQNLPIKTTLPFAGRATLSIRGSELKKVYGSRCVRVDEILDCRYEAGFDQIQYAPITSAKPSKSNNVGTDESSIDAGPTVRDLEADPEMEAIDDQPAELGPVLVVRQSRGVFAWLCAKITRKPRTTGPGDSVTTDSVDGIEGLLDAEIGTSRGRQQRLKLIAKAVATGKGTYANDAVAYKLEFTSLVDVRPVTALFELSVRAAEFLVTKKLMSFRALAIVDGKIEPSRLSSPVPKRTIDFLWRYGIQNNKVQLRRVLILELCSDGQHFYMFETERLDGEETHPTGGPLDVGELENLLTRLTDARGIWKNVETSLPQRRLNHVAGETAAALATRWSDAMNDLISDSKKSTSSPISRVI
jgi:hypothetical protein